MFKNRIRIDLNKNAKLPYYALNILKLAIPDSYFRNSLTQKLAEIDDIKYIENRVDYYNKLTSDFIFPPDTMDITTFKIKEKKKTYWFDLIEYLRYFDKKLKLAFVFGDNITVPKIPSIVKSRPISDNNENTIIMKLDKVRHFIHVNDSVDFKEKKNLLLWRGKAHQEHRKYFLNKFYTHELCDVGQIVKANDSSDIPWKKSKMSLKNQLDFKFILAIEGNDVASNLKWIMSSNSIAFMVKPKYETWFMEGRLIPNHHYVLVKDDYSDLEEKILYYSENLQESLKIIQNANNYTKQFQNKKREDLISLLVLKKYFSKSKQL